MDQSATLTNSRESDSVIQSVQIRTSFSHWKIEVLDQSEMLVRVNFFAVYFPLFWTGIRLDSVEWVGNAGRRLIWTVPANRQSFSTMYYEFLVSVTYHHKNRSMKCATYSDVTTKRLKIKSSDKCVLRQYFSPFLCMSRTCTTPDLTFHRVLGQ